MTTDIKFGTDGWRATPETGLNEENISICAQSFAKYILDHHEGDKEVLVGYDTRKNSYDFAKLTASVISANKIKVKITDTPTPTPLCSYHVKNSSMHGAVIITASHNSKEWNGFKIRSSKGLSFNDKEIYEIEKNIEYYTENKSKIKLSDSEIKSINVKNTYIDSIKKEIDIKSIKNSNIKIVVDYMHGAVSGILEEILDNEENCYLRHEYDSNFPNMEQPEPIEKNLSKLIEKVSKEKYSLGLAFDGDGDRLGVIDENGNFQTPTDIFSILAMHILGKKESIKSIATTVSMTSNIEEIGKIYKSEIIRTKVGFKYLAPLLENKKVSFAGEESGGYSIGNHLADKDGIFSALLYLENLAKSNKKPSELVDDIYSKLPKKKFERVDKNFSTEDRKSIEQKIHKLRDHLSKKFIITDENDMDGKKLFFENSSWVLTRLSGTEPVIRIYLESEEQHKLDEIKKEIIDYIDN